MDNTVAKFRCTPGNLWRVALRRQIMLLTVRRREFVQTIVFFFIAITMFRVTISPEYFTTDLVAAVLYCSWLLALITTGATALETDFNRGYLQQFHLTGVWLEVPLSAYYMTKVIFYATLWLVISPVALLILQVGYAQWWPLIFAGIVLTGTIKCTLIACRALLLGSAPTTLLGAMAIPLLLPMIILAVLAQEDNVHLLTLSLLWLSLMPISIIATAYAASTAFEDQCE